MAKKIGNGKDPQHNLYCGAGYGIKNYFKVKTEDWTQVKTITSKHSNILDRLLFKHTKEDLYMLADGLKLEHILHNDLSLSFGGHSNLISYVGHDGLMDFDFNIEYKPIVKPKQDVIILACHSKSYFTPELKKAQANPVLWTTHLMAPEAYILKAALDGLIKKETGKQINESTAKDYNKYQKCGIKGERNLFTTGS